MKSNQQLQVMGMPLTTPCSACWSEPKYSKTELTSSCSQTEVTHGPSSHALCTYETCPVYVELMPTQTVRVDASRAKKGKE